MAVTAEAINRLKAQLLTSGLSQQNQPLFQVINTLIDAATGSITAIQGITSPGGVFLPDHDHTNNPNDGGILTNDEHDGYSQYDAILSPGIPTPGLKRLWVDDVAGKRFFVARGSDGRDLVLARDNVIVVRNVTGGPLTKKQAVYFNGSSTGNFPHVSLAKADSENTMPAIGLLFEDIPNNGFGRVMVWGRLTNIDTSAFSDGDNIYISDSIAGEITNIVPTAHFSFSQRIGIVAISGIGNGAIIVTQTAVKNPISLVGPMGPPTLCCEENYDEPIIPLGSISLPLGGDVVDVPYNSGDFTGSGSMTWTVDSGDILTFAYSVINKLMTVWFTFSATTVGGTVSTDLQIKIPGGFTAARTVVGGTLRCSDNGSAGELGICVVGSSGTNIILRRSPAVASPNWTLSTNNTLVQGVLQFPIL